MSSNRVYWKEKTQNIESESYYQHVISNDMTNTGQLL